MISGKKQCGPWAQSKSKSWDLYLLCCTDWICMRVGQGRPLVEELVAHVHSVQFSFSNRTVLGPVLEPFPPQQLCQSRNRPFYRILFVRNSGRHRSFDRYCISQLNNNNNKNLLKLNTKTYPQLLDAQLNSRFRITRSSAAAQLVQRNVQGSHVLLQLACN